MAERLTFKFGDEYAVKCTDVNENVYCDENSKNAESYYQGKAIDKLAHYEDLSEKGLLVEIDEKPTKNTTELFYIYDRNIWSIEIEDIGRVIKRRGITKFYTKFAEAEQALTDMN